MFNPRPFKVREKDRIVELIRKYSLGMMFSQADGGPGVSHIPFLVDDDLHALSGHMARANPQWKTLDGRDVLVVFRGPNHYISPTWYGEEYAVPTWNYIAAHVEGSFRIVQDKTERLEVIDRIVAKFESDVGGEWRADWTNDKYMSMMDQIVVFTVEIKNAEGKWKLSQNHPAFAWKNVASELDGRESAAKDLAEVMNNDPLMYRT